MEFFRLITTFLSFEFAASSTTPGRCILPGSVCSAAQATKVFISTVLAF